MGKDKHKLKRELDMFMDFLNSKTVLRSPYSKLCLIDDYLNQKKR